MAVDTSISKYRHHVYVTHDKAGTYGGYLVIRHKDEPSKESSIESSPYGSKLEIHGVFRSREEVVREGKKLYSRYLKGEVSALPAYEEKEKLRGYRIIGKARFDADNLMWEPVLELKKMEEPNKGKRQTVVGPGTVMIRNLCRSEEMAAKFALDAGKTMILDQVGLKI